MAPRRRTLLALRVATLIFLAFAIGGLPILVPDSSRNVVVVAYPGFEHGNGGPLERVANGGGRDWADRSVDIGLVAVDANPRIAADLGGAPLSAADAMPPASPVGADLETALALAVAALPTFRSSH